MDKFFENIYFNIWIIIIHFLHLSYRNTPAAVTSTPAGQIGSKYFPDRQETGLTTEMVRVTKDDEPTPHER